MRRAPALLFLVLPLLAACSDGGSEEVVAATPSAMAAAGRSTIDAGSARTEMVMRIDGSSFGVTEPLELRVDGVQEFATARAEMTMDLSAMLDAVAAASGQELPAGFGTFVDVVQDGNDMYMCGGFVRLIAQAECIHVDLEAATGADLGALGGGGGADPSAILASLAGSGDVQEVGREDVAGVGTTHFSGVVTLRESIEASQPEQAEAIRAMVENLGLGDDFLDTELAYDVWIDDEGLVRQVRQAAELSEAAGVPAATRYDIEIRFLEFGVPVDIEVPADFVEASDLPGFGG